MKKRFLLVVTAVFILTVVFSGICLADNLLQKYAGRTINIIAEAQNPTYALEKVLPEFENLTGIRVNLTYGAMDSVVQQELLALQGGTGRFDVISTPYQFLGNFVVNNYVQPLDPFLEREDLRLPGFDQSDIIEGMWKASGFWKDKYYAVPSNTCIMMLFYRKDLFYDSSEQEAFRQRYGYELHIPRTWAQYRDIAEFFTRKEGEVLAGEVLDRDFYGVTIAAKRHDAMTCEWLNYAWSFGGGIFDREGNLIIDNQKNTAALEFFAGLKAYSPPGVSNNTWDEVTTQFQQSTVAMAVQWNDCAPSLEDPASSRVVGKMGYGQIPVNEAPAAHFGAWSYFIPSKAPNPEAAWLFLQWVNTNAVQKEIALNGGFPCLKSVYDDPELLFNLPYWHASLEAYRISNYRPRIPEWNEMNNEMMLELSKTVAGEQTAREALENLQVKFGELLQGKLPLSYK